MHPPLNAAIAAGRVPRKSAALSQESRRLCTQGRASLPQALEIELTLRTRQINIELLRPMRSASLRPSGRAQDNPALHEIWDVVCTIPQGSVATYGSVARAAGLPGHARQVGFALRIAADEMHLPWHRVVGAGGKIVFAPSSIEHREQARRLRAEGVKLIKGRIAASAMIEPEHR